jgi:glycerol-3-phosphate dehydrogenase
MAKTSRGQAPRRRRPQPGGVRWLAARDVVLDYSDVIVIGGGATGIGLAWDLTLRGLDVVLLELGHLASGTSGAFHGLLHSGARYAGSDPVTTAECLAENRILRRVARSFISDTGGVFARLEEDDPVWEERWREGCRAAGLRPQGISPAALRKLEPSLSSSVVSAYRVPDAAVNGFGLLWSMAWATAAAGARIYFGAKVVDFLTDEAGVRGVRVIGTGRVPRAGIGGSGESDLVHSSPSESVEPGEIVASVVVNATGPWASEVAALAGPTTATVPIERDKGVMLVLDTRLVSTVVNRLRPPGDGDILVPHGPVTILGTSSTHVTGSQPQAPTVSEVRHIMNEARALVPGIDRAPPLRAYAGMRPLLRPAAALDIPRADPGQTRAGAGEGRGTGRGFLLIDHGYSGGPQGLVTITGGKFTTFRAMAQATGDLIVHRMGKRTPSRTAEVGLPHPSLALSSLATVLPTRPAGLGEARKADRRPPVGSPATSHGPAKASPHLAGEKPDRVTEADLDQLLLCECELVPLSLALALLDAGLHLTDLRRLVRVGLGTCQSTFCGQRLAGVLWQAGFPGTRHRPQPDAPVIAAEIEAFRRARQTGTSIVEWGTQARLALVAEALDRLTLGRLPPGPIVRPDRDVEAEG